MRTEFELTKCVTSLFIFIYYVWDGLRFIIHAVLLPKNLNRALITTREEWLKAF